jgi:hypothetical protein
LDGVTLEGKDFESHFGVPARRWPELRQEVLLPLVWAVETAASMARATAIFMKIWHYWDGQDHLPIQRVENPPARFPGDNALTHEGFLVGWIRIFVIRNFTKFRTKNSFRISRNFLFISRNFATVFREIKMEIVSEILRN